MQQYDVVIIGSGVGGLVSGALLAREGLNVCVLEKNPQIGGALQTFARDKIIFDSGVHYMGGLAPGQNLYQIFRYIGIMDELHLVRMEEEAFDKILIEGDRREYALAQGYDNFVRRLAADFPHELDGIQAYADAIREVCSHFPLYNLRSGGAYEEKAAVLQIDAKACIDSFVRDPVLRDVLAGNAILYAGQPGKTPFYVHALVLNSFIESAWKCVDGGSQIARALARVITQSGGKVLTRAEVIRIEETEGMIRGVVLSDGRHITGDQYISSLHPARTLELTPSALIRPAYRKRILGLENSVSCFSVNIVLEPEIVPYSKQNYYYQRKGHPWATSEYTVTGWPLGYAMFLTPSRKDPAWASAVTLMAYMRFDEVAPWAGTFNTTARESDRGSSYAAFKQDRYERLLSLASEKFPWIRSAARRWYASTPLSLRDYLGTADGSLYGIVKDYQDPVRTMISARTKIPNLFLTGQSLNLHGILGSAISSLATCADLLGRDDFVDRIREA